MLCVIESKCFNLTFLNMKGAQYEIVNGKELDN